MRQPRKIVIWILTSLMAGWAIYLFSINILGAPIVAWLIISAAAPWIWPGKWLPLVTVAIVGEIATTMPPLTMVSMALIPYLLWLVRARIEPDISFSFGGWLALTIGAQTGIVYLIDLSSTMGWAGGLSGIVSAIPWLLIIKTVVFSVLGAWIVSIISIAYLTDRGR